MTELSIPRGTLATVAERLQQQAMATRTANNDLVATKKGRQTFEHIVEGYRQRLARFIKRWSNEAHSEVRTLLEVFARNLMDELPRERAKDRSSSPAKS